ncbi:hypothetical protein XA68_11911 [Ophiocordyceps unilateralis]|uniref:ABM domain-containing protein n=1 Tax=Ophiocordyceps unilateralis TaxID=268505 RepID=A0A2A9PFZ9_OPHUN|nr:hypothetical protein XA68_11911 [Ophiocordyceps unilateralis]
MATTTLELITITFKPSLKPDGDSPPSSFFSVCDQVRSVSGVAGIHHGSVLERPTDWLVAVRWESSAALDDFIASPQRTAWLAAVRALADGYLVRRATLHGRLVDALSAPCTEVFYAFGTDDDFVDARLRPFADALAAERMTGHHASAWGPLDLVVCHGCEQPPTEGPAVVMLLGWDSKEAHLAHRGDDKTIDRHIHVVREGRKSVEICHVNMTKS